MNYYLKQNPAIILLISCLFVAGCSAIHGGAALEVAIHDGGEKSEDNYDVNMNSEYSTDLRSPAIKEKEIEAFNPIVPQENPRDEISASKKKNELEEIMIPIKILNRDKIDKSLSINDYKKAVVTILTTAGHGSGFIVTEDGYVLTNQHVVGEERFVNVKLVTGREVSGEVVRIDKIGDVALIKLEEDLYPYVLLGNSSFLDIGEEVYAVGTPLEEEFSQTVTKGIVNSFRMEKGFRYIQSDVTVRGGDSGGPLVSLHNGVVGICVVGHGFLDSTIGRGLNQFIPIEDAITMLNINDKKIAIQNIEELI